MDLGLKGKVALITGGSMGIGKASAEMLAQEGAQAAIVARRLPLAEKVAAEIAGKHGVTVIALQGDMHKGEDAKRVVRQTVDRFGRIDILVNCAGSSPGGSIELLREEQWMESLNLKFMGYVRTCTAVVPVMKRQRSGRIVNVIGNDGIKPIYFELTPGAANAAGINFTQAIAEDLAKHGILVNCINPGPVDTERWWGLVRTLARERGISEEAANALAVKSIPLGRLCTPQEVAYLVVMLAADQASFVNGACITIDGGQRKAIMDT
jgi:NAD(P)-dependent dehydrogenase (short-subunit alcohol dehydrogenase family)